MLVNFPFLTTKSGENETIMNCTKAKFKIGSLLILWCHISLALLIEPFESREKKPNFVIIVADDLGIGDLGCYGNTTIKTPNIDRLAKEGIKLEHHLAAAGLCTPSRAALLTGRYPSRYGLVGEESTPRVIVHVASRVGLPRDEVTIGEVLHRSGYTTGAIGKWHLGSGCEWLGRNCGCALNYGFSYFYGLPFTLIEPLKGFQKFWIFDLSLPFYQNLFGSTLVTAALILYSVKARLNKLAVLLVISGVLFYPIIWFLFTHYRLHTTRWWQVSNWTSQNMDGVIIRNGNIVHQKVNFETLTEEFVNESIQFISNHSLDDKPFFLYHSFGHVHVPMFTSEKNVNKSSCGRYGDNVEEMDQGVGLLLKALEENGIENNTIVYFVSDHGGHLEAVDPVDGQRVGGYNKLFKGGKGMGAPEGAIRVPGILRWPKGFTPGVIIDTPTSLLDILPTFLDLAGLPSLQDIIPNAKPLDGLSFAAELKNPGTKTKFMRRILLHHCRRAIQALRLVTETKIYKMYLFLHRWHANSTQCGWGIDTMCDCYGDKIIDVHHSPILFELVADPYEDSPINNNTNEYKVVVKELMTFLTAWEKDVPYPSSLYHSVYDSTLLPWLQPNIYIS